MIHFGSYWHFKMDVAHDTQIEKLVKSIIQKGIK